MSGRTLLCPERRDSRLVSLQRSCRSCVLAKRRCDLKLPACNRCLERRLQCEYRNEPLTQRTHVVKRYSVANLHFESVTQTHSDEKLGHPTLLPHPRFPGLALAMDRATLDYLVFHMKNLPTMASHYRGNPFVHPLVTALGDDEVVAQYIENINHACSSYYHTSRRSNRRHNIVSIYASIQHLIRCTNPDTAFLSLLLSTQALILALTLLLFGNFTATSKLPSHSAVRFAPYLSILARWTGRLWNDAPSHLPSSLTAQQAFLYGESVRRTILFSSLLQGLYENLTKGFKEYKLIVEALVFDRRTRFWTDSSPLLHGNSEGLEHGYAQWNVPELVSYREFTDCWSQGKFAITGLFETILLVACKGKSAVEARLGADMLGCV